MIDTPADLVARSDFLRRLRIAANYFWNCGLTLYVTEGRIESIWDRHPYPWATAKGKHDNDPETFLQHLNVIRGQSVRSAIGDYKTGQTLTPAEICREVETCLCLPEWFVTQETLSRLEPHFEIAREVSGLHFTGKRVRIDAIVTPLNHVGFRGRPSFGIEFKSSGGWKQRMADGLASHYSQCMDYAISEFDGFGCVQVLPYLNSARAETHRKLAAPGSLGLSLLQRFGVGTLEDDARWGLTIRSGGNRIWSEDGGITGHGENWKFERKFGTR